VGVAESPPSEVFAELLRPHLPALYRLAYRFAGGQDEAEDLLQELLARLYARSERLDAVESLRPWLARALYNLFIDERRRWARNPLKHASDPDDGACTLLSQERSDNPEFQVEMTLLTQNLQELLAELPEEQRVVVLLKDVEGYGLQETANILGIALGTAKSRLHRAHLHLQKALQQRNLLPSNVVGMDESRDLSAPMPGYGVADNEV
jgi:RNA polymerase sigma factor (sigma-70 family)